MKHLWIPATLALVFSSLACGGSTGTEEPELFGGLVRFPSSPTGLAVAPDAPVSIGQRWLACLVDEAANGGTDLNGDGDALDHVVVAIEIRTRVTTKLRAASDVRVLGDEIYFTTREVEDGTDWNSDGMEDDLVLLHWSAASAAPALVAAVEQSPAVAVEDRLYFSDASDVLPAIPGATKLHFVSSSAPTSPALVLAAGTDVGVDPRPFAQEEGVLFLLQDEEAEGRDLDGDGDAHDQGVLALLDARDPSAVIRNVGLSHGAGTRVRSLAISGEDRLVVFLVDEAEQGRNLNDSALFVGGLQPVHCAGLEDTDLDDRVLHCLFLGPWSLDPVGFPPINTGLVGSERVLAIEGPGTRFVVGTLAPEAAEGGCSLNGDADQDDRVLLWAEVTPAGGSFRAAPERFVALRDAPGGVHGVVELEERFVAVLSESEDGHDLDGDAAGDEEFLSWIDPFEVAGNPEDWHRDTSWTVDWMGLEPDHRRLLVSLKPPEGSSCSNDSDDDESIVFFGRAVPGDLEFDGYCLATERFNSGQALVDDVVFFRADEASHNVDINEDGDRLDQVLVRGAVFPFQRLRYVGTLNNLPVPAVNVGQGDVATYLEDEAMAGRDENHDGDRSDFVLRTVSIR